MLFYRVFVNKQLNQNLSLVVCTQENSLSIAKTQSILMDKDFAEIGAIEEVLRGKQASPCVQHAPLCTKAAFAPGAYDC